MDCFSDLQRRGLVYDTTGEEVPRLLNEGCVTVYAGFDPTSDSLHIGNMVPLLMLARLQRHGHRPIVVAGGATGLVGDPSGKSNERNLLTPEQMAHNVECIKGQLSRFLDFDSGAPNPAVLVDNADWIGALSFLDFLRTVGKHFGVGYMLGKESVRGRLEGGISYTEFSYMLLQAYDFLHLYREHGCTLQIGGSDQWGNITAGKDLIHKVAQGKAHGLVMPLICDSSGQKLGKTSDGATYLDPQRTAPYDFYQYLVRVEDKDVVRFLRLLTFLGHEEIEALEAEVAQRPGARAAQKRLAWEFTALIHGEAAARAAEQRAQSAFGGSMADRSLAELEELASGIGVEVGERFGAEPRDIVALLAQCEVVPSRGQARRLLQQGGLYVNGQRLAAEQKTVESSALLHGRFLHVRLGKKNQRLLVFAP